MPRFHVTRRSFALFAAAALAAQLGAVAQATEAWPSKPIRIIVPNPPAGPSDIAIRPLAAAVQKVLQQPDVRQRLEQMGNSVRLESPAQFKQTVHDNRLKWAEVVKAAHISIQ